MFLLMGAEKASRAHFPRYSASYVPPAMLITDHQTNILYVYPDSPEPGKSRLAYTLDLTQAGKKEMVGVAIERKEVGDGK
jgi:hypothetical protein